MAQIDRYDHRDLGGADATDPVWNEGPVHLVATKFHGGGIVSTHRTVRAAWRAWKAYHRTDRCVGDREGVTRRASGCAGIIAVADYDRLPTVDEAWSALDLCRKGGR